MIVQRKRFMYHLAQIKNYLLSKIHRSFKNRVRRASQLVGKYLPKSLEPPFPKSLTIDPIDGCNLRCPLCPSGLKILNDRPRAMPPSTFKMILEKIPGIEHVCLFNWGEPFLNRSIFEMIESAKGKNIRTTIHSNFSLKRGGAFFDSIVASGLDTLVISLDGASKDSYAKYRIGGDFELVLSNIKRLVQSKHELDKQNPQIIWKLIINKFNENEIETAAQTAGLLGIEFETAFMGLSDDLPGIRMDETIEARKKLWLPENKKYRHLYYRKEYSLPLVSSACTQLFDTVVINPTGKVFPCCWITDEKYAFGDLTKESFEDIWYNTKYLYSRSLFLRKGYSEAKETTICTICNNYKKTKNKDRNRSVFI